MSPTPPSPQDERPHRPTDDPTWVESYLFDVVHGDGSLGLSIELLLWPQRGRSAFHASVVESGKPLIALVDAEGVAPPPPSLELRASGLWTDVGIQTPLDHVTVDIEAFAVALDDPEDVFAGAYGRRTALGSELEWETAPDGEMIVTRPISADEGAYAIPCIVHGELLLADRTIEVDGWGWRSHRWGSPLVADRVGARGRNDDGTWFHHSKPADEDFPQTVRVLGEAPVTEPSFDRPWRQRLVRTSSGAVVWIRDLDR